MAGKVTADLVEINGILSPGLRLIPSEGWRLQLWTTGPHSITAMQGGDVSHERRIDWPHRQTDHVRGVQPWRRGDDVAAVRVKGRH